MLLRKMSSYVAFDIFAICNFGLKTVAEEPSFYYIFSAFLSLPLLLSSISLPTNIFTVFIPPLSIFFLLDKNYLFVVMVSKPEGKFAIGKSSRRKLASTTIITATSRYGMKEKCAKIAKDL